MERIKTITVILGVLFLVLGIWGGNIVEKILDNSYEMKVQMESHIGEDFIIKSDTFRIVDYSFFNNTYILDNGISIHAKLVEND